MKSFALFAAGLVAAWSVAAAHAMPNQVKPVGENNQKDDGQQNNKDDGQQNNKDDGQQGQNGNAKVNELKGQAVPLGKPQLAGKKPAVARQLIAKPIQGRLVNNKAKPADGQNGQNDDGQRNNKDDGQQGQNGNNK